MLNLLLEIIFVFFFLKKIPKKKKKKKKPKQLSASAATFGWIDMRLFFLIWPMVPMQPWRLITSVFFLGPFSMSFMFNLVFLVIYQKRLEEEEAPQGFMGRTADHVWMMLIIVLALYPMSYLLDMVVISKAFSMGIVWVWCKRHEDQQLVFYGFSFRAGYFPWILTLIHVIMGASPADDIAGVIAGHIYVCFKDVFPQTHNFSLAETPQFMYNIFPPMRIGVTSVAGVHVCIFYI